MEQAVREQAKKEAAELKWELIDIQHMTDNPADDYLYLTIVKRLGGDYATHIYNTSLGGFHAGRYDMRSEEEARGDLEERKK